MWKIYLIFLHYILNIHLSITIPCPQHVLMHYRPTHTKAKQVLMLTLLYFHVVSVSV